MYINKITLDNVTYNIGPNIENTELTTSTTDVPSTNLMKTLIDEINNKIQENTNNIDELTSSSTGAIDLPTVDGCSFTQWGVGYQKKGKVVFLTLNIDGQMTAVNDFLKIFSLPQGVRPTRQIIMNYITQKGSPMCLVLETNGDFKLFNNNKAINNNEWICRQALCFLTE